MALDFFLAKVINLYFHWLWVNKLKAQQTVTVQLMYLHQYKNFHHLLCLLLLIVKVNSTSSLIPEINVKNGKIHQSLFLSLSLTHLRSHTHWHRVFFILYSKIVECVADIFTVLKCCMEMVQNSLLRRFCMQVRLTWQQLWRRSQIDLMML